MQRIFSLASASALALASHAAGAPLSFVASVPTVGISYTGDLNGRLLVAISRDATVEPRLAISETFDSQQVFGVDVKQSGGAAVVLDERGQGSPLLRLRDLPEGDYLVQAVFNRYEILKCADGHVLDLPPDRGEGQRWNAKPGNPYSAPVKLHLGPSSDAVRLTLDKVRSCFGWCSRTAA